MSKTNESLMQRRTAAVPRGVGQIHPIFAESAKNATVTDVEGREFIDFAGGIAVLNTRPPAPESGGSGARAADQTDPHLLPGAGV